MFSILFFSLSLTSSLQDDNSIFNSNRSSCLHLHSLKHKISITARRTLMSFLDSTFFLNDSKSRFAIYNLQFSILNFFLPLLLFNYYLLLFNYSFFLIPFFPNSSTTYSISSPVVNLPSENRIEA